MAAKSSIKDFAAFSWLLDQIFALAEIFHLQIRSGVSPLWKVYSVNRTAGDNNGCLPAVFDYLIFDRLIVK